jgi:hypothetical protein
MDPSLQRTSMMHKVFRQATFPILLSRVPYSHWATAPRECETLHVGPQRVTHRKQNTASANSVAIRATTMKHYDIFDPNGYNNVFVIAIVYEPVLLAGCNAFFLLLVL